MAGNKSPTRSTAWFFASLFAVLPAVAVVTLTTSYADGVGRVISNSAFAWGGAAFVCVGILRVWHSITHHFESFPTSTIVVITAIVGAFAGMVGATTASTPALALIFFVTAVLGSFQGAAVAWFIVGPDLQAPPEMKNDPDEEDEPSNPPTSTP